MADSKLKTAIIYGSVRRERRGIKVARFVDNKLQQRGHQTTLIDPLVEKLPMLDLMYREYKEGEAPPAMQRVADALCEADGFIVVSAEYNHGPPPALKNILDHYQSEYLYKPSGIVTYSKGPFGGVRGLIALRAIMAELGTPSIPSSFPVSKIDNAIDDEGVAIEKAYDERVVKFLDEYEWYARALRNARECEKCSIDMPIQQGLCQGAS